MIMESIDIIYLKYRYGQYCHAYQNISPVSIYSILHKLHGSGALCIQQRSVNCYVAPIPLIYIHEPICYDKIN